MIKQLTGTDEAAGRRCLSGLQVLIKQLTGADHAETQALIQVNVQSQTLHDLQRQATTPRYGFNF